MLRQIQDMLTEKGMDGVDPSEYISFYSLRTWGTLNGKFVCDQIYVHDKVRPSSKA